MPTLILTPRYTDDTQALWKTAGNLGWQVERLTSWRVPAHLRDVDEPVLYAEALFAPSLAEQLGLHLLEPAEDWLVRLPQEYRLRDIALTTLRDARELTVPRFIKPPNDKSFPAKVYAPGTLPDGYDEAMAVLVSDIVTWQCEFRCFIRDRVLETFSIYARYGELQRDAGFVCTEEEAAGMRAFVGTLLADPRVDLPAATVVDVGCIEGSGWAAVEQNAAWGAGIYGCDPERVLHVARRAVERR